jgi:hypothetical protein
MENFELVRLSIHEDQQYLNEKVSLVVKMWGLRVVVSYHIVAML